MNNQLSALLLGAFLAASIQQPVLAATPQASVQIIPSQDGELHSAFKDGDAPLPEDCDVPAGWDCAQVGAGAGSITQVTADEWEFDGIGGNRRTDHFFAYQEVGDADFQLKVCVDADAYTGNAVNFAGISAGVRESLAQDAFFQEITVMASAGTTTSAVYRVDATTFTSANGAPDQTQPRCVAQTYDESQDDFRTHESSDDITYTLVQQVPPPKVLANYFAFVSANSNSATIAVQGTAYDIDLDTGLGSITVYTPTPDGGGGSPVCTSIANQSYTQGIPITNLNVATACTDTQALTFTQTGLPVGTGLSLSAAGVLSGTPTAADVGTRNMIVTATDPDTNTGQVTVQISVAASPGDTFGPYGLGVVSIDCTNDETALQKGKGAGAGDTILLDGGNRPSLIIRNCNGSASSPLLIYNDINDTSPVVIVDTSGAAPTFMFEVRSVSNVVIGRPGNGAKYSGGPADWCGVSEDDNSENQQGWFDDGATACSFVVGRTQTDNPTAYMKVGGLSTKWTIQSIEIDGKNMTDGGGAGIGISVNDHNIKEDEFPTFWREDMNLLHFYVHDVGWPNGGEGIYFGPNGYGEDGQDPIDINDIPIRRARIAYGIVDGSSKECINPKYWLQGPNYIDHNHVYRCGIGTGFTGVSGRHGINMIDGGDVDIHSNWIVQPGQNGISHTIQSSISGGGNSPAEVERDTGPWYSRVYNNYIVRPGNFSGQSGRCVRHQRSAATDPQHPGTRVEFSDIDTYNNTCITPDGEAYEITSLAQVGSSGSIRDNIIGFASCSGLNDKIVPASAASNNRCASIATHQFVSSGTDDFHLTSGSPARNAGTNQAPPIDYDGDVRPQQTVDDQGADEYVP